MAVSTKPKRGEKVGFIRQHPSLKASEVVEAAKKQGIKLTTALVYNVRAAGKKRKGKKHSKGNFTGNGLVGTDLGNGLVVVAGVVKKLGGVENVRHALRLIEQVSGALE